MSALGRVANAALKTAVRAFGLGRGGRLVCKVLDEIQPSVEVRGPQGDAFRFATPNTLTLWRARSLFTKEPETLEWLDTIGPNEVLYDVGANVGVYTVYAGVRKKDLRVFCFEPTFFNYWLLNRNILLNGLTDRVQALSLALADREALDSIHMETVQDGAALVTFGDNLDFEKRRFTAKFKQGAVSTTLDAFIARYHPPFPTRIKLDVDGLEREILMGAEKTLKDPRLKSVLVELNEGLPGDMELVPYLEKCGLKFAWKRHTPVPDGEAFEKLFNYVFSR
ncbi:MAG: FkbM family methyltransferase [Elusimicrobia bacterium]|nr:FkbM family methyltransferase [Elusimicrobiota bacterium]